MQTIIMPKPLFKDDIKGRVTKPKVGLYSPSFQWVPAVKTDLAARFAPIREQINIQRAAEAAKQGKE
jgi:hypothetical protein